VTVVGYWPLPPPGSDTWNSGPGSPGGGGGPGREEGPSSPQEVCLPLPNFDSPAEIKKREQHKATLPAFTRTPSEWQTLWYGAGLSALNAIKVTFGTKDLTQGPAFGQIHGGMEIKSSLQNQNEVYNVISEKGFSDPTLLKEMYEENLQETLPSVMRTVVESSLPEAPHPPPDTQVFKIAPGCH
jgi:hypothetical protein